MTATPISDRLPSARREQIATRVIFLVVGIVMAGFAPLVPLAKLRLGLDEGALGLLLLCLGLGSILAMPITGILTARWGCRAVITVASLIMIGAFPFLAIADNWFAMAAAIAIFGASLGTVDVAMNIQAVMVERDSGRPMMSGFHGLFSLGGIAGAGGMSALLSFGGLSPLLAAIVVGLASLLLVALSFGGLLPYGDNGQQRSPLFVMPKGGVLLLGVLCLLTFLAEGSVLDWSAVFLTSVRDADIGLAGLGYAAFAVAMTGGRLAGDRIRLLLGERRVILLGGLIGALGFAVVLLVPSAHAGLVGYFLVGVGASNLVPVLFSAAGRTKDMSPGLAITAVSTLGYLGLLAGPALIGLVAHATTLPFAFVLLSAAMLAVAASFRVAR
ncbi:MFS transporter [Devosia sp. A16]|uniref:MFS transporter n=1 Tax=Devosia sp. A16 TaxID=1736675 RepID=UPI0006D834F8|nr:MFS transporter [Devosia sp. A16]